MDEFQIKVLGIVAQNSGLSPEELDMDFEMEALELTYDELSCIATDIETQFDVVMDEEQIEECSTIQDLCNEIEQNIMD